MDFKGQKRRNDTHASTTDPQARLYRKGDGQTAKMSYIGNVLMENLAELAAEVGISRRNLAYYETQHPPSSILPELAKVLNVTINELMGATPIRKAARAGSSRLQRRLAQIEKLNAREKRQILQFLDTFISVRVSVAEAGAEEKRMVSTASATTIRGITLPVVLMGSSLYDGTDIDDLAAEVLWGTKR